MFIISKNQQAQIDTWKQEQNAKVAKQQEGTDVARVGGPNYGAIGGGFTYMFTPTGLGMVIKVVNNITKEELDLTDYKDW